MSLRWLGLSLGLLVVYKLVVLRRQAFGETMMFCITRYLLPLSRRIGRGFYEDGIWADTAFIPYTRSAASAGGGRAPGDAHRHLTIAQSCTPSHVPGDKYGAARRLLRDKIGEHAIHFTGTGLDLGAHDEVG